MTGERQNATGTGLATLPLMKKTRSDERANPTPQQEKARSNEEAESKESAPEAEFVRGGATGAAVGGVLGGAGGAAAGGFFGLISGALGGDKKR